VYYNADMFARVHPQEGKKVAIAHVKGQVGSGGKNGPEVEKRRDKPRRCVGMSGG